MEDFVSDKWRPILAYNRLEDFDALWRLEAAWFEEPNHRRGGWSGVSRYELALPEGGRQAIFLKRQENHRARLWTHPIKGAPTFLREFQHILHYRRRGIPTLEPVYFAIREQDGDARAILITEELSGFVSMEDRVQQWLRDSAPPRAERRAIMLAIAGVLRDMHARGIQHNCFFPKHVFTRTGSDGQVDVRVIDLEKSRWRPFKTLCALRDLYTLNHHSLCWSLSDRLWFFRQYLGITHLNAYAKWLWRRISSISYRKKRVNIPARKLSCAPVAGEKPDLPHAG